MANKKMTYNNFLYYKSHSSNNNGFKPLWMPDFLYDFQKKLLEWSLIKGRSAIFADCGLGKTPIQLAWAENIVRKTGKKVLILTPLAVSYQTIRESEKFGVNIKRSNEGKLINNILVTNYERLQYFNREDFIGVVCDESSILKNFDGIRRGAITEFMKKIPYRLLCTATAAPNDYMELGTSSEALGIMGYMDVLNKFFKNDQNTSDTKRHWVNIGGEKIKWRFKRHAENPFWRWVCSWAMAVRYPSDIGFDNGAFILPELIEQETEIDCSRPSSGALFVLPAHGLKEQREELRETINERCMAVAKKVNTNSHAVVWCNLNAEGDLLEKIITDAKQVSGSMNDDKKESILKEFSDGNLRVLIIKPKIGAFGLNWQHCHHTTFFPSHSYEQYYQGVRRMWRFGQKYPVIVDIITTRGMYEVLKNLQRKSRQADKMFSKLVGFMNNTLKIEQKDEHIKEEIIPTWL